MLLADCKVIRKLFYSCLFYIQLQASLQRIQLPQGSLSGTIFFNHNDVTLISGFGSRVLSDTNVHLITLLLRNKINAVKGKSIRSPISRVLKLSNFFLLLEMQKFFHPRSCYIASTCVLFDISSPHCMICIAINISANR